MSVGQSQCPQKSIGEIAQEYGLEFLAYFGSYGTKFYREDSDIDIAFVSKTLLSPEEYYELIKDLIIFHRKAEVDVVDLRRADPVLRYEVAYQGRLLYEKEPGLFARYCRYYIRHSYELHRVFQERMRHLGKSVEELLRDAKQGGNMQ